MLNLNLIGGILIGSSLFVSESPEITEPPVSENKHWELKDQNKDVTIYERWIDLPDGRQTRERKGVFYVNHQMDEIVPLISSADGIKDWMRGVEKASELSLSSAESRIIYIEFDAPWPFKNRDLVTEVITDIKCDAPCTEVSLSARKDYVPEKKNTLRMNSYEARWVLTEIEKGKTQIVFSAYSDTEPVAPKWIQDPITARLFKDNLLNLKDLITENN